MTSDRERERLALLHRMNLLDAAPDPVLDDIAALAATLLKTPMALITLVDDALQYFKAKVGVTLDQTAREHSFCTHAITHPEVMVVEDAAADARFAENPLVTGEPKIRFYAGAPLFMEPGLAVGALCVLDDKPRTMSDSDKEALRQLSVLAVHYLDCSRRRVNTDPNTGLPNRKELVEEIERALPEKKPFILATIDVLDAHEFNQLIRILGHAHIDALLVAVAQILKIMLPEGARLFHVGVLRFAFMHEGSCDGAATLLSEIAERLREPIVCAGIPIVTTTCLGVAQFPEDSGRGIELLRAAVVAAHDARQQRRLWARYDNRTDRAAGRAFQLLSDVRSALRAGGQLAIHYQPKVDFGSGACVGAEALIRWRHPEFGWVSPAEFIPLAEKTPLMKPLTEHVLVSVCDQMLCWHAEGFRPKISVNVSVYDVEDPDFLRRVRLILASRGLRPADLDFEMTESGISANIEALRRPLQSLRDLGVSISIDDFGTGQSALSYLRHLPADYLKIDQVFIRSLDGDTRDQILVRSTIKLAHDLGILTVAEGVATESAYHLLRRFGCDLAQGEYLSQPLEPDAFRDWALRHQAALAVADKAAAVA